MKDKSQFEECFDNQKSFRIAEVANFLGVSTTTLRYYEEYGLIKPYEIDEETNYRYYDIKNIGEITHIIDLRRSGLSMMQIRDYLSRGFDMHVLIKELKIKREALDRQIKINELRFAGDNAYMVDYVTTKPLYCLFKESHAKDVHEIECQFAEYLIAKMKEGYALDDNFLTFIEFKTTLPEFENIDYKMFLVVNKPSNDTFLLPSIKAIHTFHKGCYETIGRAYDALCQFASRNKLKLKGTAIENYFRSSFTVNNENDMLTDVILPLDED